MNNFIEELKWRGMIQDIMPGTEEQLKKEMTAGYVGFDPTSDSLHIGNLVPIMMLKHLQLAGHKPIVLVGGATGMIGDPSGKSEERNLLSEEILRHNEGCIKVQLGKFLDYDCGANSAEMVNNYDWFKGMFVLDFFRDIGKHLTVNYMMAKDSVQKRLETGISFTEFAYQLIQGYDFYWLNKNKNCKIQMGASDQWGNIVTGTELIRRKDGGEAFALTCPLITKADGSKFGKSESGNIWLDAKKTSPYQFYQFWLNASDEDAGKYIRIFTLLTKDEIESLENKHKEALHLRILQKELAKDVTIRVHSESDYNNAIIASEILFGSGTADSLKSLPEEYLLSVFDGVPKFNINRKDIIDGIPVIDFVAEKTTIFPSKGEARKMIQGGGVSINKIKVESIEKMISSEDLLKDTYIIVQKGKKNYFLITVS
jgi:tyrosyl-tRNA synthetase